MLAKTAQLFNDAGSQAVRLPPEFRFDGDEVFVRKDERTGDVILSKKPASSTWDEYLELRDASAVPEEFMKDRPLNEALREDRKLFEEEEQ
ncbi:MAG TPA: hypothetical protein VF283_14035 [Bryobacteraceae bacterium]